MNHQQWLNWRRQGIGSSDAAVIMGVSPWKTLFELWEEKALGVNRDCDNFATRRGKDLEEPARKEFSRLIGVEVRPQAVTHEKVSWMRASLDGIDIDRKIMVEIKCPNKDDHLLAVKKKVPEKYVAQCQHQLAVMGLPGMYYFSFDGSKGVIVDVARDQQYIDEMLRQEQEFWDMVLTKTSPKFTDKDTICLEDNADWINKAKAMTLVREQLKTLEEREKELKDDFISLSQGRNAQGGGISLIKSICKGQIDYQLAIDDYLENMRAHYPEVDFPDIALEPYRKSCFTKYSVRIK